VEREPVPHVRSVPTNTMEPPLPPVLQSLGEVETEADLLPAGQELQDAAPEVEYVLAGQAWQAAEVAPPEGLEYPAGQE
jgi:hypothetical protein